MKVSIFAFFLLFIFNPFVLPAQKIFKEGYEKANPVASNSTASVEEKIRIHKQFLNRAINNYDTLSHIYGLLYLFKDYVVKNDYRAAHENVLEAELLASASGNVGWQGMVNHAKGILQVKLKNFEASLPFYQKAADLCGKAGDSLCLAESLEQLGAINGRLKHLEEASKYYELAIPLIRKYGSDISLGTTFNNFGNFLLKNKNPGLAISYYDKAIVIYRKEKKIKEEAQVLNNLASAHVQKNNYNLALAIYDSAMKLNNAFNMPENIAINYLGLAVLHEEKGDYKTAYGYLSDYQNLKDSLIGKEIQDQVADLTAKYNLKEKELNLKKSQLSLTQTKKAVQKRNFIILFICLFMASGLIFWYFQSQKKKNEILRQQENLTLLTNVLLSKNTQLVEMEQKLALVAEEKTQHIASEEFGRALYNTRILTDDDWRSFKSQYEKAYPGYLIRIRKTFPEISEAEERLFLLLRQNLKSKEIASMLGISADSVKKTRSRLRRRLAIEQETGLEEYVQAF